MTQPKLNKIREVLVASMNYILNQNGTDFNSVIVDPFVDGKHYCEYYKFKSKEQYDDWKQKTIHHLKHHAKLSASAAKKWFKFIDIQFGLNKDYGQTSEALQQDIANQEKGDSGSGSGSEELS